MSALTQPLADGVDVGQAELIWNWLNLPGALAHSLRGARPELRPIISSVVFQE